MNIIKIILTVSIICDLVKTEIELYQAKKTIEDLKIQLQNFSKSIDNK